MQLDIVQASETPYPKWETAAQDRVENAVKEFSKPLADMLARDANEGDTRLVVTDSLCEGLCAQVCEEVARSRASGLYHRMCAGQVRALMMPSMLFQSICPPPP